MRVIESNGTYSIMSDDELVILENIPAGCYELNFTKEKGVFLKKKQNFSIDCKVYGSHEKRVEKTLSSFKDQDKSLGVILSGKKGMGKTLFTKLLSIRSIEDGFPVIIIRENYPMLVHFLESITQECVVIFDEFEKNFSNGYGDETCHSEQAQLLSMFDGLDTTKKLFIITCNNVKDLNEYFINRPGRFHYHFKLKYLSIDEIKEYLNDKLGEEYLECIKELCFYATVTPISYDSLSAIVKEIKRGYELSEIFEDLNIECENNAQFKIVLKLKNGEVFSSKQCYTIALGAEMANITIFPTNKDEDKNLKMVLSMDLKDTTFQNGKWIVNSLYYCCIMPNNSDKTWGLDLKDPMKKYVEADEIESVELIPINNAVKIHKEAQNA